MPKYYSLFFIFTLLFLSACSKDRKETVNPPVKSKETPRPQSERSDDDLSETYDPKDPNRRRPNDRSEPPSVPDGKPYVNAFTQANKRDDELCALWKKGQSNSSWLKEQPRKKRKEINAVRNSQCLYHRLSVPGAKCGNGEPYHIYMSKNALKMDVAERSKKLRIIFQGGGACWSKKSCCLDWKSCSSNAAAGIFAAHPYKPHYSLATRVESIHAEKYRVRGRTKAGKRKKTSNRFFSDHSLILFPYCTGDVFMGKHQANYEGEKVFHNGIDVVMKSLKLLKEKKIIEFERAESVLVYGFSAGGIGALYHLPNIDKLIPVSSNKTIIADAPGLHYGPTFWKKFPQKYFSDISDALKQAYDYTISKNDGLIADVLENACAKYRRWKFAVIQSDMDRTMSETFGGGKNEETEEHSMKAHQKLVREHPRGLLSVMSKDESDNCIGFIAKDDRWHTLMVTEEFAFRNYFLGASKEAKRRSLIEMTKRVAFEGWTQTIYEKYSSR